MKIRNGFVSNSSSSSFIVAFPRIPLNWEDVKQIVFGDSISEVVHPYLDISFSVEQVSQTIFDDMIRQSLIPLSEGMILTFLEEDSAVDYLEDYFKEDDPVKREKLREEADEKRHEAAKKRAKNFLKENKGSFIYHFEYADDEGEYGATLEHSDIFRRLNHTIISHH